MTLEELKLQRDELDARIAEMEATQIGIPISLDEAEQEKQHQEDLQRLRGFRLIDDDFMNACFDGYIEGAELLLRIILDKPDIRVKSSTTQKRLKNLLGRDVCLDIDADDDSGKKYNIEIQRSDKGADRKRARYHSSILDAHQLKPGDDFSDLPETFVIFITENDVIGGGLPIYTIDRQITNMNQPFDDGEHIIYVNGENRNASTELGLLMHDFFCTDADDMHYKELADKVRYFKEDEKGVAAMCKVLEDMRNESARAAVEHRNVEFANTLLKLGKLTFEEVAESAGLTIEQVKQLASSKVAG